MKFLTIIYTIFTFLIRSVSRDFRSSLAFTLALLFFPSLALADPPRILNLQASQGTNAPGTNTITLSFEVVRGQFPPHDLTGDRLYLYFNGNCEGFPTQIALNDYGTQTHEVENLAGGTNHTFSVRVLEGVGGYGYGPCVGPAVGHALAEPATIGQDFDITPRDRIRINYGSPQTSLVSEVRLFRSLSPSLACDPNTLVLATGPTSGLQQFADPGVSEIGRDIYYFSQQVGVNGITGHCSAPLTAWIPPEAPASFQASDNENPLAINLQWSAVPGAIAYNLYRYSDAAYPNPFVFWGTVTGLSHTDYDFHNPFEDVIYAVRPTGINGREGPSTAYGRVGQASDSGYRAYSAPSNVAASDWSGYKVDVAWDTPQPAPEPAWVRPPGVRYRVFRSTSDQRCQGSPIGISYSSNQYEDRTAVPGTPYYYSVQGFFEDSHSRIIHNGLCSTTAVGLRALLYANGRVVTQSGAGLGGVLVQASSGNSAVTNSDGYFSIAGLNGTYYFNATLSGYTISPNFSNPVAVTHTTVNGLMFQALTVPTPTSSATATPTPTMTTTPTRTPTRTATFTATSTASPTPTRTGTATFTPINSSTPSRTPTSTMTTTPTRTSTTTVVPTDVATETPTSVPTATPIVTSTSTRISTVTPTITVTSPTPGATPTSPPAIQSVVPIAECIDQDDSGSFIAHFGYRNDSIAAITLPIGESNYLSPQIEGVNPPTQFEPGAHSGAVLVPLVSSEARWTILGSSAVLTATDRRCCGDFDCSSCAENSLESVITEMTTPLATLEDAYRTLSVKVLRSLKNKALTKKLKRIEVAALKLKDSFRASLSVVPLTVWQCPGACFPLNPETKLLEAINSSTSIFDLRIKSVKILSQSLRANSSKQVRMLKKQLSSLARSLSTERINLETQSLSVSRICD